MTLSELLNVVDYKGNIDDFDVKSITCDSRQIEPGAVFFCISGEKSDGHKHAKSALESGAKAVVVEKDLGLNEQIIVENTRIAYSLVSANFYGNPASKLKIMAVTGTNGKTTVTYVMKQILEAAGKKVGLIGTIQNQIDDLNIPAKYTTPDPIQLHAMLARMVEAGCEYVVMEVSSHALSQHRVEGINFLTAAFTNLTQDHLDYHKTMEEYYKAKRMLFENCKSAIINIDDEYGQRLAKEVSCVVSTISAKGQDSHYTAHDIRFSAKGSNYAIMLGDNIHRIKFCMPGMFSVSNSLVAAASCVAAGIDIDTAIKGLAQCSGVVGRVEILPTDTPYTIIRDYAHSPDGLKNILETVREFSPGRIVTLFGCAGNRDRTKRPLMTEIVARLSDFYILTSDNPRDESPQQIIDDALPGGKIFSTPYKVIPDRYSAIEWAIKNSREGDTLILAGKGHEDYQVLDFGTIYFDEKEIVLKLLSTEGKG